MLITRTSIITGTTSALDLPVTQVQLDSYAAGEYIQFAFPGLTSAQREFIMSGITPEQWAAEIGEDDEN